MQLQVPVSVGEVLDKITILQIKLAHISDAAKRANIQNELDALLPLVAGDAFTTDQMQALMAELKSVNEALWDIEDDIREKEAAKSFDAEFIRLARAVYITNDKRAKIKKQINLATGSAWSKRNLTNLINSVRRFKLSRCLQHFGALIDNVIRRNAV